MDEKKKTCAERIKEIRKRTGLSQAAFASAFRIPQSTVECWECGKRECPPYVIDLLDFRVSHEYE